MEVLSTILSSILAEACRSLCGSVSSNIRSITWWNSNVQAFEKEIEVLTDLRTKVKRQFESTDRRSPSYIKVERWLRETEGFLTKAQQTIQAKKGEVKCSRIRLGGELARALKKARSLVKDGDFPDGIVEIEYIPGPSIPRDQTTPSRTLDDLIRLLDGDGFVRIGVWGMGGVGKTTLVKNLNNKLQRSDCLRNPFSVVIWATVSKDMDPRRVQMQISERLSLEAKIEESLESAASRLYRRLTKEEKFLLILDDLWEKIDLDLLGIPGKEGSKVIITTRSLEVCGSMRTDADVKVEFLSEEESWQLFCRNAGNVAVSDEIRPFAERLTRECRGLPLAIVAAGAAMRGKSIVELWKNALSELRRSVPFVGGIKSQVYSPLKLSYDSLEQGTNTKACFLYCALFPEDSSISIRELASCWASEGLIEESRDFESSLHRAMAIVESLKDSCLLEDGDGDGTVKMHDVVRDMAIWIGSSLGDGFKFHVRSGIGLSEVLGSELSDDSLGRVSLANNRIKELPDCEARCSKASTLLLQGNLRLEKVPGDFLKSFRSLRVLNVSDTRIKSLPGSLLELGELRALLLRNCFFLEELPPLGVLTKLQILDLCATRIREVPRDMENLTSLRQVDLSRTHYLQRFEAGVVSRWTCLEILDMTLSSCHWGSERGEASFEELGRLKRLFSLSIRMKKIPCLGPEAMEWVEKLRRYQFFIGETVNSLPSRHDKRRVTISGTNVSGEWTVWLLKNASALVLNGCKGLNEMLEGFAVSSTENYVDISSVNSCSFMALRSLTISSSNDRIVQGGCAALYDMAPNLEELRLRGLTNLTSVSEFVGHLGLMFPNLRSIEVARCPQMKCLLSYGNFILSLPRLETIDISFCEKLEELFNYTSGETLAADPVVPSLRVLELKSLPKVKKLCRVTETWPKLERVSVAKCNLLTYLPIGVENSSVIKEIIGESQWWTGLRWSQAVESAMRVHFKPIDSVV